MSDEPELAEGRRLLGIVPGHPTAGERKVPEEQGLVMVWPHLLVRHAVAALVEAGAEAIQLFDSWAGCLTESDYRRFVLPYSRRVIQAVQAQGVPAIHFSTGTAGMLPALDEAGADVLSVDWRIRLGRAWEQVAYRPAIQGNLDPAALFAPWAELRGAVEAVLAEADGRDGHIFNLGHGILPGTPVENVRAVVAHVHERAARQVHRERIHPEGVHRKRAEAKKSDG